MAHHHAAQPLALVRWQRGHVRDVEVPAAVADDAAHGHGLRRRRVHDVAAVPAAGDGAVGHGLGDGGQAGGGAEVAVVGDGGEAGVEGVVRGEIGLWDGHDEAGERAGDVCEESPVLYGGEVGKRCSRLALALAVCFG